MRIFGTEWNTYIENSVYSGGVARDSLLYIFADFTIFFFSFTHFFICLKCVSLTRTSANFGKCVVYLTATTKNPLSTDHHQAPHTQPIYVRNTFTFIHTCVRSSSSIILLCLIRARLSHDLRVSFGGERTLADTHFLFY